MPLVLLLLFFSSGLATLVYEVTWLKLLAGSLSNSSHVLSMVLAGFLLGLAMGSRLASKREDLARRPIRTYAWLECSIFIGALAMPYLLRGMSQAALTFLSPELAHAVRLVGCGSLLFLVTIPMGATFPFQVASFQAAPQRALRASAFILAFQTAGGMSGVLLSGFFWLPAFGIHNTHYLAVSITGLVAAGAWVLSVREEEVEVDPPLPDQVPGVGGMRFVALCTLVGVVGGASLALEVFYTRILSFFLPDLAWSFSAVLGVYLLCLALGAFLSTRMTKVGATLHGASVLALVGAFLAVASLATLPFLYDLLHWFEEKPSGGFDGGAFLIAALVGSFVLVAPAAVCLAAFLPLGIGLLAPGRGSSPSAGVAFSVNSLGSSLGALVAGLVLVPTIGIKWGVATVAFLVLSGAVGLFVVASRGERPSRNHWIIGGTAMASFFGMTIVADLDRPLILDSGVFQRRLATKLGRRLVEVREGSVTVASVVEEQGQRVLFNDAFQAAGTSSSYQYMKMLGHVPMLLAEQPEDVLVIAFGTGTTAGSVSRHASVKQLTLVEISPEVLELAPHFESFNFGLPEQAPSHLELEVHVDDGRAFLRRTDREYDVITLEPLFPHTPGAVHFYTRDFFALTRERLSDGGVLCHWIPLHGQPMMSFLSILKSFSEVFAAYDVCVYGSNAVLLGWNGERRLATLEEMERRRLEPDVQADLQAAGVERLEDVLGAYVAHGELLSESLQPIPGVTDDRPRILYADVRPNIEHRLYLAESLRYLLSKVAAEIPWTQGWSASQAEGLEIAREVKLQAMKRHAAREELDYQEYHRTVGNAAD